MSPLRRVLLLAAGAFAVLVIVVLVTALFSRPAGAQVVPLPPTAFRSVNPQLMGPLPSVAAVVTEGPQGEPDVAAVATTLTSQVTSVASSVAATVSGSTGGLPTPTLPIDPGRIVPTLPLPILPPPNLPAPLPPLPTVAADPPALPTLVAPVDVSDAGSGQTASATSAPRRIPTSDRGTAPQWSAVDTPGVLGPAPGGTSLQPVTVGDLAVGGLVGGRAGGASPHGGTPFTFAASTDATLAAMLIACLALARVAGRGLLLDERAARPA